ncbi:hypothetical protein DFH06DRAFT_595059 [Mycena polygramma]|nr:hypothetical protein DFH06DRAFT_595059 [Mycena polygramma]
MLCTQCGSAVPRDDFHLDPIGLPDLRTQLSRLDTLIASLTAERQRLQAQSDAIVYPVLSLPTEITMEIFLRCLPSQPRLPCPSMSPLLLTRICHHWREIALDTPGLWQSLIFRDRQGSVEILRLWLSRSGTLPLNFSLHCWDPLRVGTLIEAAMSHSHHWQDIKLGLPISSFKDLNLRHTPFPVLRSLSLDIIQWSGEDETTETVVIQDAPSLREVHVSTFPNIKIGVPWSQLTALTLRDDVELTECLSFLRGCLNLVNLTVRTIGPAAFHTDILALDSLQSLDCNILDGAATLLQYLALPRLERLTITDAHQIEHASIFGAFIVRSACRNLRHLSLSVPNTIQHENLTLFFRAVPNSVSVLHLVWPRVGLPEQLFNALLPIDILPQVTTLHLQGGRLRDTDHRSLLDMLRTRLEAPVLLLRSLVLDLNMYSSYTRQYEPTVSTMSQLRELASAGLKIKFTVTSRSGYNTRMLLNSEAA